VLEKESMTFTRKTFLGMAAAAVAPKRFRLHKKSSPKRAFSNYQSRVSSRKPHSHSIVAGGFPEIS
jgi:hypothetical protein